ncbi:MAG TPA: YigZ family protein [Prolixibacteraceae bacterium]|nr:YigZ family protein [Prolixibacteraceae bacterium]
MTHDTYTTVEAPAEGFFKEKGSRFISCLYPVTTEEQIREILLKIKKEHYNARHHCYAWRLGQEHIRFRANDDGEPSSTAGKPILGQLVSHHLTDVLLVVVRYFGGTLLGTSGLIQAYREAAANAIHHATPVTRLITTSWQLEFGYGEMNAVMQLLKNENLTPEEMQLTEKCRILLAVRKSDAARVTDLIKAIYGVKVSPFPAVDN